MISFASPLTIANLCRLKRLNAMKTGSMPGMSVITPILGVSVSVLCPNYSQDQRQCPRCVSRKVASVQVSMVTSLEKCRAICTETTIRVFLPAIIDISTIYLLVM